LLHNQTIISQIFQLLKESNNTKINISPILQKKNLLPQQKLTKKDLISSKKIIPTNQLIEKYIFKISH